jgi:hypothetical protein
VQQFLPDSLPGRAEVDRCLLSLCAAAADRETRYPGNHSRRR